MRRILIAPFLALALVLGGCAQLGEILHVTTTTITNPVSAVDIYRVKTVYAATLQAAVDWRAYCWSKPYADLMNDRIGQPLCQHRRPWLRQIQLAKAKASAAILDAQAFVQNNPTLNASSVIAAAMAAVTNFKNAVPATN